MSYLPLKFLAWLSINACIKKGEVEVPWVVQLFRGCPVWLPFPLLPRSFPFVASSNIYISITLVAFLTFALPLRLDQ